MGRGTTSGTKIKSKKTAKNKHSRVLDQINHNAAGIDAGAEFHYVAVPEDRELTS